MTRRQYTTPVGMSAESSTVPNRDSLFGAGRESWVQLRGNFRIRGHAIDGKKLIDGFRAWC